MDPLITLQTDMKNALRAGDRERLDAIRFLISQVQNLQIDKGRDTQVSESDLHQVVKKLIKNTEEAIEQYSAAGRDDLVGEEKARIAIWQTYLPQQLSDEELLAIAQKVFEQNPGLGIGPLTGMVLREAAGKADGGRASAALRQVMGS